MTPQQAILVQSTFASLASRTEDVAALFYERLFELDPELQALFKSDLKEQGRKLMRMLDVAVDALCRFYEVVPAVKELGRRHLGYGVTDGDYDTVGAALLWTLEQGLGDSFTPDVKNAWAAAYGVLAGTMKGAAAGVPA